MLRQEHLSQLTDHCIIYYMLFQKQILGMYIYFSNLDMYSFSWKIREIGNLYIYSRIKLCKWAFQRFSEMG